MRGAQNGGSGRSCESMPEDARDGPPGPLGYLPNTKDHQGLRTRITCSRHSGGYVRGWDVGRTGGCATCQFLPSCLSGVVFKSMPAKREDAPRDSSYPRVFSGPYSQAYELKGRMRHETAPTLVHMRVRMWVPCVDARSEGCATRQLLRNKYMLPFGNFVYSTSLLHS